MQSLRGSTASLQVGVCVPSEVELKCPCVNPISSVQLLSRAVKSPLIKVSH